MKSNAPQNISLTLCFTAVCVQVAQSVSRDSELASVNALGQGMASFSRAAGPMCGGLLWSAFLTAGEVGGNFVLVSGILVVAVFLNLRLHLPLPGPAAAASAPQGNGARV